MNSRSFLLPLAPLALALVASARPTETPAPARAADWSLNATIIEACSCPMFCQCYFNAEPADHSACCPASASGGASHFCRFNNAFQVNRGHHGATKLDGMRFWVAGDLGGDFSKGEMKWAVLHFEPSATPEQRAGVQAALGHLYPVKWGSFEVGIDYPILWQGGKDRSVAKLDDGKVAEVVLARTKGMTDEPVVIRNLRYWGAPRNDGFVLMANEIEAYRVGDAPFEFKGSNGFMITVDISSADVGRKVESARAPR
jgi:hypothetical protein